MKICLTTYFDKNFSKMGNLCLESMKKYAEKHRFDVKLHNEISSERPPPWNKILVIKKLLDDPKKYDYIFWIDSDAVFVNFEENIRNAIESGKDFYLVKPFIDGRTAPNTGVMLIKNSTWIRNFLDRVWNMDEYVYSIGWENAAICDLLGFRATQNKPREFFQKALYKLKIKNQASVIFRKVRVGRIFSKSFEKNNSKSESGGKSEFLDRVKWLDIRWNALPDYEKIYKKMNNAIIHHYPSMAYNERLKRMLEDSKR